MKTLKEIYDKVISKANEASNWYAYSKKNKKKYSKWIRFWSIILFGFGGLIPLINALFLENDFKFNFLNLGYISIAFAGTLLLLDRFFGFSSGWIRYMTTEMEIQKKIREFELRWEIETFRADLVSIPPEEAKELLRMLMDFSVLIDEIVKEETSSWVTEFQSSMAELQKSINNKLETTQPGNIKVNVNQFNNYKNIKIKLDSLAFANMISPIYLYKEVSSGYHLITITGQKLEPISNFEMAEVAKVEAGKLTEVTINLA
ncbi:SLATT domain-containing protein [Aquiflexum sp. TKW24L]|uniref:SLATT domain-containing protein n=1 Tax=Aquiflexum sp. TKW24L TaxID=2942212 RepID=UPI0020C073A2|nr:SLATT domain-containing protein [Aquiflexum sp. TKW24L]MCL6257452.1 SLATT domain-containing protein [Aquiflexum sp. TKW24L]